MPTQFSQTVRSLTNDRSPAPILAWFLATVLLCAWLLWSVFGGVTVYETSGKARLEVMQLPHHVAAPLSGRILSAPVAIGREVLANQVLIELDASAEKLRLAEEETKLAGLPPRMESMRAELVSLEQAKDDELRAMQAALSAATARIKEVDAAVKFARSNESRKKKLRTAGSVSEVDVLRSQSEADELSASKDAIAADAKRLEQDRRMHVHEAQARIENMRRSIISLEGEMATTRATIARIRQTIDRHVIRAPVSGHIGDAAELHVGAYVAEGQRLVAVVPAGELMAVGEFIPGSAIGRVRPGQHATMRLEGFPWAQYGSIDATVSRVATEIRNNAVRVEFTLARDGNPDDIMQHGVPGAIEVAVERAAPASLILRAAGLMLSATMREATANAAGPAE